MQKLYKINKNDQDRIAINDVRELNTINMQVRTIKLLCETLEKTLDNMGIGSYGTYHNQVLLKDYLVDDEDNVVVKSSKNS